MKKSFLTILVVFCFVLSTQSSFATVAYMDIYNKDKAAKSSMKNKCSVCHVSPSGGGARNSFGEAYAAAGKKITDSIRQQFPDLFSVIASTEPKIVRVAPASVFAGVEVKLMIIGKNFASDSTVKLDGSDLDSSQVLFVNSKKIEVTITFDDSGVHTFQVVNATGQASNTSKKVKVKPAKN